MDDVETDTQTGSRQCQIEILLPDKRRQVQQRFGLICFFIVIVMVIGILIGFVVYLATNR